MQSMLGAEKEARMSSNYDLVDALCLMDRYGFELKIEKDFESHEWRYILTSHVLESKSLEEIIEWITLEFDEK